MRNLLVFLSVLFSALPAAAATLEKGALDRLFDHVGLPDRLPASVQTRAVPARELDPQAARLLEAAASLQKDPVWPGFKILAQPILLYKVGESTLLIGHPSPPAGYKAVSSSRVTVFEKPGAFDLDGPFDYHRALNGSDTFAYRVDPGQDALETARIVTHERFHVYQEKAFGPYRHGEPSLSVNAKTIALAALEQRALSKALLADTAEDLRSYARTFVAIRESRYAEDADCLRVVEESEERLEGMARYVDSRTMQRLATPAHLWTFRNLTERLEMLPDQERLLKWRLYETGAGQGFLLDAGPLAARWKTKVAAGTPVFEMMRQAYPLEEADRARLLGEAQAALGYAGLLRAAETKVRETAAAREAAVRAFAEAPGPELSVPVPWTQDNSIAVSFSNGGPAFHIDDHTELFTKMGVFEAKGPGFLMRVQDRAMMSGMNMERFHAGKDLRILLDGRPAPSGDGTFRFRAVSITEPGLEIRADRIGTLTVKGRQFSISWAPWEE